MVELSSNREVHKHGEMRMGRKLLRNLNFETIIHTIAAKHQVSLAVTCQALITEKVIVVSSEGSGRDIPQNRVSARGDSAHPGAAKPGLTIVILVLGLGLSIAHAAPATLPRSRWLRSMSLERRRRQDGQSSGTECLQGGSGDGCHTRSDDMIRHGVVLSLSRIYDQGVKGAHDFSEFSPKAKAAPVR
ncbi:hypothetical protein GE21DRAFT_1890 [Neurospora crassa]|uniref:Uncharacterized protein n=1 Tax=Neurospora crassa (strain ATCC 24698 / 74-OR23-1A / CBS 708.71 / DSM 1257 / FGSC 987) TaxID=367110 RepID=Q7SEB5_NEUCR|nr:hypothetical protein NCU00819 [Neurospora crassa OR74A]EAA35126.2 hypothetical protein NCU00819 [Neurospora crassa OR74A]KHE79832.1 hypothetical protein GE21DRAFT_1890 [Neurospora crassa]|eukprot:XP_964362.2 hypothetical protein NCU00819 [Neurospora crassa OR74A]